MSTQDEVGIDLSRSTKTMLLVLSHLAAVTVGAAAGYFLGERSSLDSVESGDAALSSVYAAYVDMQRAVGSGQEYRNAVMGYLAALDSARRVKHPPFNDQRYHAEKTLAYMRLALQAERDGRESEVNEPLSMAVTTCADAGWADCSAERLRIEATRAEQDGLAANPGRNSAIR